MKNKAVFITVCALVVFIALGAFTGFAADYEYKEAQEIRRLRDLEPNSYFEEIAPGNNISRAHKLIIGHDVYIFITHLYSSEMSEPIWGDVSIYQYGVKVHPEFINEVWNGSERIYPPDSD